MWGICCNGNGLVNAYSWSGVRPGTTSECGLSQWEVWLFCFLVDWIESQWSVHFLFSHSSFPKQSVLLCHLKLICCSLSFTSHGFYRNTNFFFFFDLVVVVARAHLCAVIHFCCATLQRNLADVEDVKFVINFDYPNNSEDYIHRIGRTARSQKTGTAYTFFTHNNVRQAGDLVSVLREANQAINPKLLQMVEDRGGKLDTETAVVDARSYYISFIIFYYFNNPFVSISGRSRGGRGGDFRDDRRDRYSGRRDFGGYRDRDNSRGYDNKSFGANSQNGVYGASNGTSNGFTGYGNGQSTFANANPAAAFAVQNNFQAQQFAPAKNGTQAAVAHTPFPFPQTQAPPQHPTPLVPYSMPPQFTQ